MKLLLPGSIRANLILVVLAGVLPLLAVTLHSGWERRDRFIREANLTAGRLADSFAEQQEQVTAGIRQMLDALSLLPEVQAMDPDACNLLFQHVLGANPNHGNFALVRPDGEAVASAVPFTQASFADMKHFREARDTGQFAVGEYALGRVSGVPALTFAHPVLAPRGRLLGVLSTSLGLRSFSQHFDKAQLPPDSFIGITDWRGVRLLRHPVRETNPLGRPIAPDVWKQVQTVGSEARFTETGLDGVRRIYAVRRLRLEPDREPYLNIFVAIPEAHVVAEADAITRDYLAWVGLSLLFSCGLAWVVGKYGIMQRVNRLAHAARRLGAGELSARSGLTETRGALGQLATALDGMAAALEQDMAERRRAAEDLRQSEERYRFLFTAQLDAFALHEIVLDRDGQPADYRFLAVNPAYEQLTGWKAPGILQRTVREVFPHLDELWLGLYAQVALDGRAMRFEKYNPDLGRHLEINAYRPQPGQLAMVLRDVTERRRTARELARAKAAAEAANKAKAEFLANMSHELRTPLNGVLGMLQLLDGDPGMAHDHKVLLETALESGRGLLTIINDILSFAQLDAGRLTIAREPADLREIAGSVCRGFRYEAQDRGVELACAVDEAVPAVLLTDAGRLRQILLNLVSNAMKFTPGGRIEVAAAMLPATPSPADRVLLLTVSDTGIGIPDDKQDAIFEPFTQVDGSLTRKYQGAGIGLGIVRHLAQLMGGGVCLESEAGAGSAFHVTVRCGWALQPAAARIRDASAVPGLAGLRVLIAEDDRVNMLTALRFLERLGCVATAAGNGREALELLAAGEFDCILMDVQMPVLDGFEAARTIRKSPELGAKAHIPIVAMTAHALAEDRQRCLAAGMDGYISKPVDLDELARVLAEAVGRSREGAAS